MRWMLGHSLHYNINIVTILCSREVNVPDRRYHNLWLHLNHYVPYLYSLFEMVRNRYQSILLSVHLKPFQKSFYIPVCPYTLVCNTSFDTIIRKVRFAHIWARCQEHPFLIRCATPMGLPGYKFVHKFVQAQQEEKIRAYVEPDDLSIPTQIQIIGFSLGSCSSRVELEISSGWWVGLDCYTLIYPDSPPYIWTHTQTQKTYNLLR